MLWNWQKSIHRNHTNMVSVDSMVSPNGSHCNLYSSQMCFQVRSKKNNSKINQNIWTNNLRSNMHLFKYFQSINKFQTNFNYNFLNFNLILKFPALACPKYMLVERIIQFSRDNETILIQVSSVEVFLGNVLGLHFFKWYYAILNENIWYLSK